MLTTVAQRYRDGRAGFVLDLSRGVFEPRGYEVVRVERYADPRAFVEGHHYSRSWPSAVEVFELRRHGQLVGVVVFGEPGGGNVLRCWFPGHEKTSLELNRMVLLDEVPFNAETWLIARCFEMLWREGYTGIVSFSDPMSRETLAGEMILPGHVGVAYAASSAYYLGRTGRETQWLFADGTVFPSRARTKLRAYAAGKPERVRQGWQYARRDLLAQGAAPFTFEPGDPRVAVWCDEALAALARRRTHDGQHRYAWARRGGARKDLDRHLETKGVRPLPYPKVDATILLARARMNEQRRRRAAGAS